LGGNRKGSLRTIFNLFVVWGLTGLWHGASWNFVLWGLYFFVFLVVEKTFFGKILAKLPKFIGHIYLLVVVYFGWVLFRFENTEIMFTVLRGMFCLNSNSFVSQEIIMYLKDNLFFIVISVFACTPVVKIARKYIDVLSKKNQKVNVVYSVFRAAIPAVLVIVSAVCLVGDSYNPFLYFRF
ncbi:MAG: MBOAT family protein, partial [Clostridia bacterium]|nr:MBOAT family protein [Clostridia bacterium]